MADDGFISRWSKRKADVRAGKELTEEPKLEAPAQPAPVPAALDSPPEPTPAPLTLEDVKSLTFDSDFKRFIAPDVAPDVKNAAVKKLFSDARFNVRDPMDVYADDYSIPDPLPESQLRKLAVSQVLGLFEENADDAAKQSVAESQAAPPAVPEPPDADPDLRLQQDDAPAGESAGDGVERGTSAAHDAVPPRGAAIPEGDPGE